MHYCDYYKCHAIEDSVYDCRLCYCPFYEICQKTNSYPLFNGYILKNGLLACENCTFFHIKENADKYFLLKNEGLALSDIFDFFIEKISDNIL